MNNDKLKSAIVEAYQKGYHEGFADACDTIASALTEATTSIVNLKEAAQEAMAKAVVRELKEEE